MKRKKYWLILLNLLLAAGLFIEEAKAQHPQPYLQTAHEFFGHSRSQEAYDIETDSNGYVFLVGPGGVSRFDGQGFHEIWGAGKFEGAVIISVDKDVRGRLWVKSLTGEIGRIDQDSIVPFPFPDQLPYSSAPSYDDFHLDSNNLLSLGIRSQGMWQISNTGEAKELSADNQIAKVHGFVVTYLKDGTAFQYSTLHRDSSDAKIKHKLYFLDEHHNLTFITQLEQTRTRYESSLIQHDDGSFTFSPGSNEIIKFTKDSVLYHRSFHFGIIKLFADDADNLWVGTAGQGVFRVKDDQFEQADYFLPGSNSAAVATDPKGGVWIKTNRSAFAYYPKISASRYQNSAGQPFLVNMAGMVTDGERVFVLSDSDVIHVLQHDSVVQLHAPVLPVTDLLPARLTTPSKIYYDQVNGLLWVGYYGHVACWDGESWKMFSLGEERELSSRVRGFQVLPDGTVLGVSATFLFSIKGEEVKTFAFLGKSTGKLSCFLVTPEGDYWVGTLNGLWRWDGTKYVRPFEKMPEPLLTRCRGLVYLKDRIGVLIKGGDLMTIDGDSVAPLLNAEGLPLKLAEVTFDKQGTIWGRNQITSTGVCQIEIQGGQTNVVNYAFDDSPSREFHPWNFVVNHDYVYLGSTAGIFRMARNELVIKHPDLLSVIKEARVNHQKINLQARNELEHNQNSINLFFDAITYRDFAPEFQIRLLNWDSTWSKSQYPAIQYTNLPPGEYTFQIQARVLQEPWGPIKEVVFNIATPYWQTWWFLILGTLALIGITVLLFFWRLQLQRRRTALEIDKLKAEQRAMIAQMNPHFMFNALSSIQELVYNQHKKQAVINIALFARLMRKILHHSSREKVTLSEEAETLDLYLRLESLRFEDQFEYEIHIGSGLDAEKQQLPPVFIQPFVENAIKHGLLNKEPLGGKLSIRFEQHDQHLRCTIEDDGVGRQKSAQIQAQRNPAHRSFSTHLVEERVALFNQQQKSKMYLTVTDLIDDQQRPCGTRVEIQIPTIE